MKNKFLLSLTCSFALLYNACSVFAATTSATKIQRVDYEGFTLWLDCNQHGAVKFQYNAQRDTGNFPRLEKFYLDKNVPSDCQQTSAKTYGRNYDRGHLVPANHLDYSKQAISDSNSMANILPQAATMNRGAWLLTEEIIECYRDIDELLVIGGAIWGKNTKDDYFVKSHGIKTPDAYWKVVIRGGINDEQVISWIVPNSSTAQRSKLDNYLVSVAEIERRTGEKLPVNAELKNDALKKSWLLPKGCNKG